MTSDLWVDIFEPQTLDQMIGQKELVNAFKQYVKDKHIPNMTISGAPGCGKTLLLKCFATDLGYVKYVDGKQVDLMPGQFYIFNASVDRRIEYVRTTMKRISENPTLNGMPRLIVLDEFDYTPEAQAAMRSLMQECSDNTRFILLANNHTKIIEPIISRCPLKIAQPLLIEDIKVLVERIQKVKEFKISQEAIELLYKITMGDLREFIGKLQDACIISNYNVLPQHVQSVDVDVQTAKSILEASKTNPEQAREVMVTVFAKTRNSELILKKLYEATYLVVFSDVMPDNEIIQRRIRDRISEIDYRITQGTNQLMQLDSLINYIQLLKFIPLQCPKVK